MHFQQQLVEGLNFGFLKFTQYWHLLTVGDTLLCDGNNIQTLVWLLSCVHGKDSELKCLTSLLPDIYMDINQLSRETPPPPPKKSPHV